MAHRSVGIAGRFGGTYTRAAMSIAVVAILLGSAGSVLAIGSRSSASPPTPGIHPATGGTLTLSKQNVAFTGNVQTDFAGDLLYFNYNATPWGATNNITGLYAAYNATDLFLGLNGSADGNSIMFFLSNETNSGLGSNNITSLGAWSGRDINFVNPINYEAAVYVSGANTGPSGAQAARITSPVAASNTTNQTYVAINNTWNVSTSGYEVAIPWSGLFPGGITGAVGLQLSAFVVGGSGAWLGMGAPYLQTGLYNDGSSEAYFLVNNTLSIVAPNVVQHTFTLNNENVAFTGDPQSDFAGDLIYTNTNTTQWGPANNITGFYAAYNATDLFLGLNASADGNSIMFFLSNETGSPLGTTNITGLAAWSGHNENFTSPINYLAAVYSSGANSGQSGQTAVRITSNVSASDTTNQDYEVINNTWDFGSSGYEVAIPWTGLYPSGYVGAAGLHLSAFVAGGGAWVGMGAPYLQIGQYNAGGSQFNFEVNDTFSVVAPSIDVQSSSAPPVTPIGLDIIFNDHQPFYESINSSAYYLPWTVVHLEEYAEQAIIAGDYPTVNLTYSLSGSLLYQIEAIAAGDYNNSYLQTAYIPTAQWNNSVYTEVTQHGYSFLGSLVSPADWNTTNVSQVIEFDLAFNTPLWVYQAGTPAANEYAALDAIEGSQIASGVTMSPENLTNALVEFFLWSVSYPIVSGQLGAQYRNSTLLALYNASSFELSALSTITAFYPHEAALTLAAFAADRMTNSGGGGNVELLTTAFDHPLLPLLLLNNWTGESGDAILKGVWGNDTTAQLNIGRDLYDRIFGQYPTGLWSSEQAVSDALVPYINASGYSWTSSSQNTLSEAGISTPSGATPSATEMENLYTPYRVWGPNNTTSTVMVFRDEDVSNDWGFNYGGIAEASGSWAAVGTFISYLKNVAATVPNAKHNSTLVTVALDGENWMFESPFPEDAVPFLQDLYTALEQNSSWLHTYTVQQYLATDPTLPTLSNLPIGSWNPEPAGPGINEYLGQWAGHGPQDSTWQQLTLVRSEVAAYGTANGLSQPENLTDLSAYNDYPSLTTWNATTAQGAYDEAWTALYLAEGSDITFSFDPADQSLYSQNALVFENEFRADLSQALSVLGLPLTPFLNATYVAPLTPTTWGANASESPVLSGSLYTTEAFPGGTAYSANNDAWRGAYEDATGNSASGAGEIAETYYAFDANNLYFSVGVNGNTSAFRTPNFYTPAEDQINIYFSGANPGTGNLAALAVPDSVYGVGADSFGFAATTEMSILGSSITSTGSANVNWYTSSASGGWTYSNALDGNGFVGDMLQLEIPLKDLGMVPGDSVEFSVAIVNTTTGAPLSLDGPLEVTVPSSLATLTQISAIHNPAPSDGPGNYVYPTGTEYYPANSVDMQWVNVSLNNYVVEFNITFGNLSNVFGGPYGFTQPIIDIYVHEPGATGTTAGLPGVNINLSANSAWAWAIQAAGWPANTYLESASGVSNPTAVLVSTNLANASTAPDRTVSIEVPTSVIGSAITTYTYTIVAGFQDGYATNGWDQVTANASEYAGGGSLALDSPNVFSYIAPAAVGSNATLTQENLLANYTNTSYPTLVAVALPLLNVTVTAPVSLAGSAVVNSTPSGPGTGFTAFYTVGPTVFSTTSTNGELWTSPTSFATLAWDPVGLAAAGDGTVPAWLAWNGTSWEFETVTGTTATGTASGAIVSAALTSWNGAYYAAVDVGGTVEILALSSPGAPIGTDALAATAVGLASTGSSTYLAYATASGEDVISLGLGAAAAFGSTPLWSAPLPIASATVTAIAVAAGTGAAFEVAVAVLNGTASEVLAANGSAAFVLEAADGLDYSPSLVIGSGATEPVYLAFSDLSGVGNVFFFATPLGELSSTKSSPPSSSTSSIPSWVWIAVAVVVVLIIVGAVLGMRGRKPPTSAAPSAGPSTPTTDTSSGGTPPSTGGSS